MEKDSKYALIAIIALFAVSAVFGGYVYLAQKQPIEASSNASGPALIGDPIPLKMGWNDLENGKFSITLKSKIIGINGSLMSVQSAIDKGIISQVATQDKSKVLGKQISKIEAKSDFSIYAVDIGQSPAFYVQTIN